ncbi:hypothetical protein K7566_04795 [Stenotrophomonas maltophilia]|nr:hypothetical protein [Stenotrophomonas maltophilia]UXB21034.1 hypothetical protein K7566_04795 [Stenotrophomonas maltophilia]SQG09468.1 phage tail assembly protein I [Stenotrophomonas maltophilia]
MNDAVNSQAQVNPVLVTYGCHDTKGVFIGPAVIIDGIYEGQQ